MTSYSVPCQVPLRPTGGGPYGGQVNANGDITLLIFIAQGNPPPTPVGGSFNFDNATFVAPTGWSASPIISTNTNIWWSLAYTSRANSTINWSVPAPFVGSGSTTAPGGPNSAVQFNDNGAFGGSANLNWDGTKLNVNTVSANVGNSLALQSPNSIIELGNTQANWVRVISSATGGEPAIISGSTATNSNLVIAGKGAGGVQLGLNSDPTPLLAADAAAQTAFTPGESGQVLTSAGAGRTPYWATPSGGGGGGTFTTTVIWTGGTATKNAFISPGVANNQGITISLVASSGSGQITNARVGLNGVLLSNSYTSTGTWPNLSIAIPVADLLGNAAQTAASVTVSVTGVFNTDNFNVANAGTLMNNQPVAFSTNFSVFYNATLLPYYTTTATVSWNYTNSSQITSFGGTVTIPNQVGTLNATSASGTFANPQPIVGGTIGGSATGTGTAGAGSSTVPFSGTLAAVPTYVPAFYLQTSSVLPPSFATSSTQTTGAAQGSTITYPLASASTQYNWLATQRPLANIFISTSFGNVPFAPDVTSANQTISGQVFNVYGLTNLTAGQAVTLVIT
ncbi:MAG: hypothetical protein ORN54_10245 [Cyclobacteriaceae bacterium]|nr:hypothetical protein [Cyclobacteriaceae bacterium]